MRYMARLQDQVQGPFSLLDIIRLPGVERSTLLCPEDRVIDWTPLGELLKRHQRLDYLFRARETVERLAASNKALQGRLAGAQRELGDRCEELKRQNESLLHEARLSEPYRRRVQELESQIEGAERAKVEASNALSDLQRRFAVVEAALAVGVIGLALVLRQPRVHGEE